MTDNLLTKRERRLKLRNLKLSRDFVTLKRENPEATDHRIIRMIADTNAMTYQGVRKILIKMDVYPTSKIYERENNHQG